MLSENSLSSVRSSLYDFDNVFSSTVFRNILLPLPQSILQDFYFVYGDFNKLSHINANYGVDTGTRCLQQATRYLSQSLKGLWARVGGDEFSVLVPKQTKGNEGIEDQIQTANCILKQHGSELKNLTITLAYEDPDSFSSPLETFLSAQKKVEDAKIEKSPNQSIKDPWEQLEHLSQEACSQFLEAFRLPADQKVSPVEIEKRSQLIQRITKDMLHGKISLKPDFEDSDSQNFSSMFSTKKAEAFYRVLIEANPQLISQYLTKINQEDMKTLGDCLFRSHHTQLLNRTFFTNNFLPLNANKEEEFQVSYFSCAGIKISNYIRGHEKTDLALKRVANYIKQGVSNNLPITNDKRKPFLFDFGGGDFVLILPKNLSLSRQTLVNLPGSPNSVSCPSKFDCALALLDQVKRKRNWKNNSYVKRILR